MSEEIILTSKFQAALTVPKDGLEGYQPALGDTSECEATVQLGLFFDGTNNNRFHDTPTYGESNIARLASCYPTDRAAGLFSFYTNGVGTEFPEVAEPTSSRFGGAFGRGGYARILYSMLVSLDAIAIRADVGRMFNADQVKGLCSNVRSSNVLAELEKLGRNEGLMDYEDNDTARENFFFG